MICFFLHQLNDLVTLVRGNLTKLARMILGALIVIEVFKFNMLWLNVAQQLCMSPFDATPSWLYSNFTQLRASVHQNSSKESKRSHSCSFCVGQIYLIHCFHYFSRLAWNTLIDQSFVTPNVFRNSEVRAPNQCSGRPWVRIPTGTRSVLFVLRSYYFTQVIVFLVLLQLEV